MPRESFIESQIPTGVESPVYLDARQIARGMGQHLTECFVGQVTGAGGAGGTLTGVPFNPALIETINEAGAAPSHSKYVMLGTPIGIQTILAVADATTEAPSVAAVAGPPPTWDVTIDTADAPDAEVTTVICWGARDVNGSL
jgi:hypothetical protein